MLVLVWAVQASKYGSISLSLLASSSISGGGAMAGESAEARGEGKGEEERVDGAMGEEEEARPGMPER